MKPLVAIVGRPNVGKSTLFNRIAGRRLALVEDVPGVTRDRRYADSEWGGRAFTIIDTGGLIPAENDPLVHRVQEQAELAVQESDAVVFLVDAKAGLSPIDQELAVLLRKKGKPVLLAVNKIDGQSQEAAVSDFYSLGFSDVFPISAEHARGLGALLDRLVSVLPAADAAEPDAPAPDVIRVGIVGRPNVGKSSLLNALLGEERVIVSELPGTTRDPIDTEVRHHGRAFVLTDTAGIRKKRSVVQGVEQSAVLAALRAMERCDVVALVLDATEPGVEQDARLAGMTEAKGRALVIVVNKWDLLSKVKQSDFRTQLKNELKFVSYAPILFTSAVTKSGVSKILDVSAKLQEQRTSWLPTPELNRVLEEATGLRPPPLGGGRPLRLYYVAQIATAPPTFAFTCNRPELLPENYKRYLAHQLRSHFDLKVPIRLLFRARSGRSKATRDQRRERPRGARKSRARRGAAAGAMRH